MLGGHTGRQRLSPHDGPSIRVCSLSFVPIASRGFTKYVSRWFARCSGSIPVVQFGILFMDGLGQYMRNSKQLLLATRPFAFEQRWRSWMHLVLTIMALVVLFGVARSPLHWAIRVPFSVMAGLVIIRCFILYHDHQHGAILRRSKIAKCIMYAYGLAALNPPSVWKETHDYHHRNNSRTLNPNVGSFPLLTVEEYAASSRLNRFHYHVARNPVTIAMAYVTVFLFGMCIQPIIENPRRHFDAIVSIAVHFSLVWLLCANLSDVFLVWIIPFAIASAAGAYLFFAQHNFPSATFHVAGEWDYVFAALHSSSYIAMGPILSWFTGNIGYHHIHHLNEKIPFYRLPAAMAAIDELQCPASTSLRPRDILACLRLKLLDTKTGHLTAWPAAGTTTTSSATTISEVQDLVPIGVAVQSASGNYATVGRSTHGDDGRSAASPQPIESIAQQPAEIL
jgi:omega-6 fatty acid desaturase (delta-12 desaturase)